MKTRTIDELESEFRTIASAFGYRYSLQGSLCQVPTLSKSGYMMLLHDGHYSFESIPYSCYDDKKKFKHSVEQCIKKLYNRMVAEVKHYPDVMLKLSIDGCLLEEVEVEEMELF